MPRDAKRVFVRTKEFDKAFHKMDNTLQQLTINYLQKLQLAPNSGGLNLKQPKGALDRRVWIGRVTDDYRAVQFIVDGIYYLVTVLPHDDAYKFAEKITLEVNTVSGGIELLDLGGLSHEPRLPDTDSPGSADPGLQRAPGPGGLFDRISDKDLVRLGVNKLLLPMLRALTTVEQLLSACETLPDLAQEVLCALQDGKSPDEVWAEVTAKYAAGQEEPSQQTEDLETALERPASLTSFTLSEDLEELERALLGPMDLWRTFLHPTQRRLAYRQPGRPYNGPVRVTGGPGTGKTVVAVHRVAALADAYPDDPILLTTYTTTLAEQLSALLTSLCGPAVLDRVTVRNIDKVAFELADLPPGTQLLGDERLLARWRTLLEERAADYSTDGDLPTWWDAHWLYGEWTQVVLALGLDTRDEYFAARRRGRGLRISRTDRAAIWPLFEAFDRDQEHDKVIGYKQLAARAAQNACASASLEPRRRYAHIVIDEAQDLHPAHWRMLRALAASGPDDLFICGDTHQRIYDSRVALGTLGIDIRGRSHKLTLNYRTTKQILTAAAGLLDGEEFDDLDGGAEDLRGYRSVLSGAAADIHGYPSQAAELTALVERIASWQRTDEILPRDIVVTARTRALCDAAVAALTAAGLSASLVTSGKAPAKGDHVHVMTMHRTKGLEYRAVAVVGASEGVIPPPSAITPASRDPLQHTQDLRAERSLLFVAATRARERLAISWSGKPSRFLDSDNGAMGEPSDR